jgi:hypothetical protein
MNRTIAIVCVLVATLMLVGAISRIINVQPASAWWGFPSIPSSSSAGSTGGSGAGSNVHIQNQVNSGDNAAGQ